MEVHGRVDDTRERKRRYSRVGISNFSASHLKESLERRDAHTARSSGSTIYYRVYFNSVIGGIYSADSVAPTTGVGRRFIPVLLARTAFFSERRRNALP